MAYPLFIIYVCMCRIILTTARPWAITTTIRDPWEKQQRGVAAWSVRVFVRNKWSRWVSFYFRLLAAGSFTGERWKKSGLFDTRRSDLFFSIGVLSPSLPVDGGEEIVLPGPARDENANESRWQQWRRGGPAVLVFYLAPPRITGRLMAQSFVPHTYTHSNVRSHTYLWNWDFSVFLKRKVSISCQKYIYIRLSPVVTLFPSFVSGFIYMYMFVREKLLFHHPHRLHVKHQNDNDTRGMIWYEMRVCVPDKRARTSAISPPPPP